MSPTKENRLKLSREPLVPDGSPSQTQDFTHNRLNSCHMTMRAFLRKKIPVAMPQYTGRTNQSHVFSVSWCPVHFVLASYCKKKKLHVSGIVFLWMRFFFFDFSEMWLTHRQTFRFLPKKSLHSHCYAVTYVFFFLFVSSLLFFLHTNFPFLFFFLPPTTNLHFIFFSSLLSPSHLCKLHLNVFPLFCIFQPGFAAEAAGWLTASFQYMN